MKKTNKRTRRKFTGEFKAKVAVEALKAQETVNQIEVLPQNPTSGLTRTRKEPLG